MADTEKKAPAKKPAAAKAQTKKKTTGARTGGAAKKSAARRKKTPKILNPFVITSASRKKRGKKNGRRQISALITAVLLMGIAAIGILAIRQVMRYRTFQAMRQVVERQTFYEGTTVEGIDVSGMTLGEAQEKWASEIEPNYAARTVTFTNVEGRQITAGELGYESNYLSVLSSAWDAARSGSLEERYKQITERTVEAVNYDVTRRYVDEELLAKYVAAAARTLNQSATEPRVISFDASDYSFTFEEGTAGRELDTARMAADIRSVLSAGSGSVTLVLNDVYPENTVSDIQDGYGLIASARTNASSSSRARLSNLRVALSSINGVAIAPGETFSFNGTVGQRTTERGYQPAAAYAAGEIIEEVGGGICQVSTTLFNAVVKADLEITERHNHSIPVGYVDKGKDATVDWNRLDFKFKNNTDQTVFIGAYLNSDRRVIVGIFGKQFTDGHTITVEGVTTGTEDYETVYEVNPDLPVGTQNVKQEGRTGYTAEAYKIVWDQDGNQISRTLLCKSRYLARNQIIEISN